VVGGDRDGFKVINVSDPFIPGSGFSCDLKPDDWGYPSADVFVRDNLAYVADRSNGLLRCEVDFDKSEITCPEFWNPAESVWGVFVDNDYAYVGSSSGLQVIDISNPDNPVIKGSTTTPGPANGVYVSGDYAYVAEGPNGLQVIDIRDPDNPLPEGLCDTPGSAQAVVVSGDYAYVADFVSGLQVIDISNPASLKIKGSYDTSDAQGIAVSGNYAILADGDSGIQVIDIRDSQDLKPAASYGTLGRARDVFVKGNALYVAGDGVDLQVLNFK
jgi:hypothetical protein